MTSPATPTVEHDITKDEVKQIEEDERQRRVDQAQASLHDDKSRLDIQDLEDKARQERLKDEVQATIDPTSSAKQSLDHSRKEAEMIQGALKSGWLETQQ